MHSTSANTVCLVHIPELLEFLCCLLMTRVYDYSFVQTSDTGLIGVMYFNMTNVPT